MGAAQQDSVIKIASNTATVDRSMNQTLEVTAQHEIAHTSLRFLRRKARVQLVTF